MGKIAPILEVRIPTKYDEAYFRDLLLTLKRQHEEIAKVINYQHGVDVAFLATNQVNQGPFSAETTINFATEDFDLQGDYDGVNKFTAPVNGIYHLGAQVVLFNMTAGDVFAIRMKKNISTILFSDLFEVPTGATRAVLKIHNLSRLDAGDAITITGIRTSGASATEVGVSSNATFFYGRAEIVIPP